MGLLRPPSFPEPELGEDATQVERDAAAAWTAIARTFIAQQASREDVARSLGVQIPDLIWLFHLDPERGTSQRELAAQWACDPAWVTNRVDRLEELGLVERRISPADRRVKEVWLTEAGRTARERGRAGFARPPASLAELPPDDLHHLAELLARLLEVEADDPTARGTVGTS